MGQLPPGIPEHPQAPGHYSFQQYGPDVRWMDRRTLRSQHREYDRDKPLSVDRRGGHSYSPEEWQDRVDDVRENGIRSPLVVQYDRGTHRAIVGEGNHRLVWAGLAGHDAVPVRVHVYKTPGFLNDRTGPHHAVLGQQFVPDSGYVKGDGWKPGEVFDKDHYAGNPQIGREIIVRDHTGRVLRPGDELRRPQ